MFNLLQFILDMKPEEVLRFLGTDVWPVLSKVLLGVLAGAAWIFRTQRKDLEALHKKLNELEEKYKAKLESLEESYKSRLEALEEREKKKNDTLQDKIRDLQAKVMALESVNHLYESKLKDLLNVKNYLKLVDPRFGGLPDPSQIENVSFDDILNEETKETKKLPRKETE